MSSNSENICSHHYCKSCHNDFNVTDEYNGCHCYCLKCGCTLISNSYDDIEINNDIEINKFEKYDKLFDQVYSFIQFSEYYNPLSSYYGEFSNLNDVRYISYVQKYFERVICPILSLGHPIVKTFCVSLNEPIVCIELDSYSLNDPFNCIILNYVNENKNSIIKYIGVSIGNNCLGEPFINHYLELNHDKWLLFVKSVKNK